MSVSFFIARKLKLRRSGSKSSTLSVRVSTAGVALSIAVMLLTIAIVRGFKQQITEKIVGFDAQLTITSAVNNLDSEQPFVPDEQFRNVVLRSIESSAGSEAASQVVFSPSVTYPGMLKTDDDFAALMFRAYEPDHDFSFLEQNLVEGAIPFADTECSDRIVISSTTASKLALKVGDKVNTVFFSDGKIRLRKLVVAGIFNTNFGEYDEVVGYAPISMLRKICRLQPDEATRVEINGLPMGRLADITENLRVDLASALYAGETADYLQCTSVLQTGAIYFNWLDLLDTNVVVIIVLMALISLFTLVASLFILILERVSLIGTLKTIGAGNLLIRKVFIILASKILLRGLVIGNIVGLGIILIQGTTHILPLDPVAYYISFVPVDIVWWQVLVLNAAAIVAAVATMIIPSMIISRMQPSKTIRYE